MTCSPLEYFAFPASLLFLVVVGENCVKMCHDDVPSFEPEPELFLEWVLNLYLVSVGVLLGLDGYITWTNIILLPYFKYPIQNIHQPALCPSTTFPRIVDIELILYIVCHCQIRNYLTQLLSFDICYLMMSSGSYSEKKLYDFCQKIEMQIDM